MDCGTLLAWGNFHQWHRMSLRLRGKQKQTGLVETNPKIQHFYLNCQCSLQLHMKCWIKSLSPKDQNSSCDSAPSANVLHFTEKLMQINVQSLARLFSNSLHAATSTVQRTVDALHEDQIKPSLLHQFDMHQLQASVRIFQDKKKKQAKQS